MKLCKNGLHDKNLPGGRYADGACRPCRLAHYAAHRTHYAVLMVAWDAAHPRDRRAYHLAYKATPAGRESRARSLYQVWRKDIAQRLVSKPQRIAALEAELEGLLTNGT